MLPITLGLVSFTMVSGSMIKVLGYYLPWILLGGSLLRAGWRLELDVLQNRIRYYRSNRSNTGAAVSFMDNRPLQTSELTTCYGGSGLIFSPAEDKVRRRRG
ncbi:hypothetical protein V1527DRAFT_475471 [Lipomyces starkeyi]